ncbi:MAG: hypothetical protein Q9227_009449 [Pyrenula ochraceoflavens]
MDLGLVYERRLIEAYIAENGTEPSTNEALTAEDLIDLKNSNTVKPRPPTLTSIPSLLGAFQEEWDALALETYTLRQNLLQTRQELSTALYQHDAAVRVIARLTKERDEAREALSKVSVGQRAPPSGNGDAMQVDGGSLPAAVISRIEETQEKLMKTRRKRPVPEDWATANDISSLKPRVSSEPLYPGGRVLALDSSGDRALLGDVDGVAGIYSLSQQKVLQALKGGAAITGGVWAGSNTVFSTSAGDVRIFDGSEEIAAFKAHAGAVTGLALHPCGSILASSGSDSSYVLYDLSNMSVLAQIFSNSALTSVQFHPDGHLLAAGGTDGQTKVFDVKSGTLAATFTSSGPIQSLKFSENGTWLATAVEGSTQISVWDLRKSAEIKVLDAKATVESLDWDFTGQYLLTGGKGAVTVQQYSKASKEWSEPLTVAVSASAVAWGKSAQSIVGLSREGVVTLLTSA